MGLLSREIVRRMAPFVVAGAAGAAGAVIAQRRLSERRRPSLTPARPRPAPEPTPAPPVAEPAPPPRAPAPPPTPAPRVVEPTPPPEGLESVVRSALAAPAVVAGGTVDVEIVGAMVVLRGQVDTPDAIRELERTAAGVPGVEEVRVLLHLPGRAGRRAGRPE